MQAGRWSCIIGQMGKSGHGEARQGKAVRGEVRHNKARGMATGVWAKGLQPASLTRIMTGRLLDSKPAAVAAGSKKEESLLKRASKSGAGTTEYRAGSVTDRKRATGGSRLGAGERGKEKKDF